MTEMPHDVRDSLLDDLEQIVEALTLKVVIEHLATFTRLNSRDKQLTQTQRDSWGRDNEVLEAVIRRFDIEN